MSQRSRRLVEMAQKNRNQFSDEEFSDTDSDPYETSDSLQDPTYTVSRSDDSQSLGEDDQPDETEDVLVGEGGGNTTDNLTQNEDGTYVIQTANVQDNNSDTQNSSDVEIESNSQNVRHIPSGSDLWTDVKRNHLVFPYNEESGIKPEYAAVLVHAEIFEFYSLFIDNEILEMMVEQTNLYATQELTSADDISQASRLHNWTPTNKNEMRQLLGLLGYMGLVKMPSVKDYWSQKRLFKNSVVSEVMTRNRFQLLLTFWHFSDNQQCPAGDRVYKIEPLLKMFIKKCQEIYVPGKVVCIDESLIPFRGRLLMKQYIPNKTHKYGLKMFKLCCDNGYTWNMKLYAGKEQNPTTSVPTKIVMELSEKLLNTGRTMITDNWYTSLELANQLLDNNTHLVGTLRANRRGNPKSVTSKKLKVGENIVKENNRGICVGKWRDKRDVLFLSTKHGDETVEVTRYTGNIEKPAAIMEYNSGKFSIDISDQMTSYNTALRKTIKWYRKIAVEILLGTAVVNAHILYRNITGKNITISEFRQHIITSLLEPTENSEEIDNQECAATSTKRQKMNTHTFAKRDGPALKTRKYCRGCYDKKVKFNLEKNKVKKVTTYCANCENEPHYCLECFTTSHK